MSFVCLQLIILTLIDLLTDRSYDPIETSFDALPIVLKKIYSSQNTTFDCNIGAIRYTNKPSIYGAPLSPSPITVCSRFLTITFERVIEIFLL